MPKIRKRVGNHKTHTIMQGEFKQCPNGHYYQGDHCPYCKSSNQSGNATSLKTEVFVGGGSGDTSAPTQVDGGGYTGGTKTTIGEGGATTTTTGTGAPSKPTGNPNRTVFGDDEPTDPSAPQDPNKKSPRFGRKLVGWLVTYSQDELGVDYKLYEGRNIIGRDIDCSITINDGRVSGKHAVLLFRANKYSITDSQSSHGTFVNGEDIELDPRYLQDGDEIRVGSTILKFRSSL